jgi:hypothetical protein
MATAYSILCFNRDGALHRLITSPFADLHAAILFGVTECGRCERLTVYADGRTLWNGSLAEARAECPSCEGVQASLH